MPITFSEQFNVSAEVLESTGVFDVILDIDTRVFIDPALLELCTEPEFLDARKKVEKYFSDIITLLRHSKNPTDMYWRRADRMLTFTELSGTCFGYSQNGTGGNAIGSVLRKSILNTIKELMVEGETDPVLFELLGVFQEGIGCDRVSDLITFILRENILIYTQRVVELAEIDSIAVSFGHKRYKTCRNPHNNKPLLLLPSAILSPLPTADSFDDIDWICHENERVREEINSYFDLGKKTRLHKSQILALMHSSMSFRTALVTAYKATPKTTYDFSKDPAGEYLRGIEINGEIANIDEQLSKLDLLWLDEQRKTIALLGEEIFSLNQDRDQKNQRIGDLKKTIHLLEQEVLPDQYQQLIGIEDRLQDEFPVEYQQNVGIPRYQQELSRLKRADVVYKNFSNRLEQSVNEREATRRKLFAARKEYTDRFKPCSFRVESMDNDEYEAEQRLLEESELPKYREKIRAARESAMEQFQNDFLAKLKSSIDQVQDQVRSLNRALRQAQFGTDSYQFRVERNPDYAEYYDMIMAPELMEGDMGLFALPFQDKYGHLIEKLFGQITTADDTQLNARKQSELQENIQRYTDFRTYLKFDLETTDQNGSKQLLSQTLNTKSGGETQTPFYIAVLASFAQLYRVNDTSSFGNTVRLAVFDEAFNKMDSDRIIESVRLLRKMGLQAIICTPPDKVSDIMPIADRTLLVDKNKYKMHILPFGKEMAQ